MLYFVLQVRAKGVTVLAALIQVLAYLTMYSPEPEQRRLHDGSFQTPDPRVQGNDCGHLLHVEAAASLDLTESDGHESEPSLVTADQYRVSG